MELFKFLIINNELFIFSIVIAIFSFLFIKSLPLYLSKYFPLCVANDKTSVFHKPFIRGIGIIFPLVLIINFFIIKTPIDNIDVILILICSFVGFWDDKFGINQKRKLLIFIILGVTYSFYINSITDSFNYYSFVLNSFIFVFIVLFFNQIDGINGLATLTFLTVIFLLGSYFNDIWFLLPILFSVISYLIINIKGNIGIQGDTGSFFMGALVSVLYFKVFEWFEFGVLFFILSPVLYDICTTTLIRSYFGCNLVVGHRNNFYQKLATRYKNHIIVAGSFCVAQIISCIFIMNLLNNLHSNELYFIMVLVMFFLTLIFLYISYLIHTNKILYEKK